jgi:hypothetical protein
LLSLEPDSLAFSPGARVEGPDLLPGRPCTLLESCDGVAVGAVEEPLDPVVALEPEPLAAGPDLLPGWPGTPGFETPPEPGAFCVCSSDFDDFDGLVVCAQAGSDAAASATAAAKLTIFLMAHLVAVIALANRRGRRPVPRRHAARIGRY